MLRPPSGRIFVFSPWIEEHLGKKKSIWSLDMFNECGMLCREYGLQLGYSNNDFEFHTKVEEELLYSLILDQVDPCLI